MTMRRADYVLNSTPKRTSMLRILVRKRSYLRQNGSEVNFY